MKELIKQPKSIDVFLSIVDKLSSAVIDDFKIGEHLAADTVYHLFALHPEEMEKVALLDPLGYDVFIVSKIFAQDVVLNRIGEHSQIDPDRASAILEVPQSGFVWQIRIFQ